MTPRHLARIQRLLLVHLIRLAPGTRRGSVCQQLHVAALVEQVEPADRLLDRLAHGQEAVVAEQDGALVAQGLRDVVAFVRGEDDAFAFEDYVVLGLSGYSYVLEVGKEATYIVEDR